MADTKMLKRPEQNVESSDRGVIPPLSSTVVSSILVVLDSLAILVAGYISYDLIVVYSINGNVYISAVLFIWIATLSLMNFGGLYHFDIALRPRARLSYILLAFGIAYLFLLAAAFSLKISDSFSRIWISCFAASSTVLLVGQRYLCARLLAKLLRQDGFKRSLAVIGEGEQLERLSSALAQNMAVPVRITGIYSCEDQDQLAKPGHSARGGLDDLIAAVRNNKIDDVAIALPWFKDKEIEALVVRLRELPINVYLVSDLVGFRIPLRSPPGHLDALPLSEVVGKPMSGWDVALKGAEDYILASLILVAISPLLLLIAILIKLDSPGPVIYSQKRVGFNNEVFPVFKFRSMYHGEQSDRIIVQATAHDPRITRVGRILRRWSLDELPQLLNVLTGKMSLVGPRPHALAHNEEFALRTQHYFGRHRVKPGITGLAQIRGFRGETDTKEKLEGRIKNDLHYVDNWSPLLDLYILAKTAVICIVGKNAH